MKLQELPIESVANALGLSVNRHKSLCPFHDDSNPSLTFNVRKNRYRCFVCDAHGGTIDLVMRYLNKPFIEACRWLSEGSGIMVDGLGNFPQPSSLNPQPFERSDHYNSKPFDASKYQRFFERPWLNDEARHFLFEERHLDPRVIRYCRLTSWRDRQGTPWLQTPYYDVEGNLVGIQNRNLAYGKRSSFQSSKSEKNLIQNQSDTESEKFSGRFSNNFERSDHKFSNSQILDMKPRFRFPRGAKCSIYNLPVLNMLKPGEPLYIAEGCSDCWSLLSAGHKAIAIPSATTLHQSELKKVLETWNVKLGTPLHIYPDQDIPGEKLYLQLTLLSAQAGLTLIRHSLPPGCKDFSDFYLQQHLKPELLKLET